MSALPISATPLVSAHAAPAPVPEAVVAQVRAVVAGSRPAGAPWATGLASLDAMLGGGIPRGRITQITGALAVGKTALLRQVAATVLRTGSWVAWIDTGRTLAPAAFAGLGSRLVVIRLPPDRRHRAAWTADLLLRSGVFGLVVLDGAPALSRVQGVRLSQLARERDAACVVLEHLGNGLPRHRLAGTLRLRVSQASAAPHTVPRAAPRAAPRTASRTASRIRITVEKGGTGLPHQTIEVDRVIVMARRVCTDSEIPDRRGVARSARRAWTARGNSSDTQPATGALEHTEHPVTWGGLGVGSHDLYGTDLPGHPARAAARHETDVGDRHPVPFPLSDRDTPLGDRGLPEFPQPARGGSADDEGSLDRWSIRRIERREQGTRDWTTYRGRRRAAESTFGRKERPTPR